MVVGRIPRKLEKMEDLESFLICSNPKCRYLVDLKEGTQVLDRASLIIEECPECGYLGWTPVLELTEAERRAPRERARDERRAHTVA